MRRYGSSRQTFLMRRYGRSSTSGGNSAKLNDRPEVVRKLRSNNRLPRDKTNAREMKTVNTVVPAPKVAKARKAVRARAVRVRVARARKAVMVRVARARKAVRDRADKAVNEVRARVAVVVSADSSRLYGF